ncbi:phospholipase A1-IIgamma-like [Euphorbia lathyris]|uniref:phospholipase A1-IIgamma-like n=1 Tax=Euphorbia lathyris TaxID=212925 RepID=UPI00331370D9
MSSIAQNWKNLSGQNNWEGLLDPLNIDLRRYIIHYGERAQAIIDAFNDQKMSKGYGLNRFPAEDFFSKVGLEHGNPYKYSLCNFIYARSEIKMFNWIVEGESCLIGYVAVATDEGKGVLGRRDILISWRGIGRHDMDLSEDALVLFVSGSEIFGESCDGNNVKVHKGFHSVYTAKDLDSTYSKTSAREQVIKAVRKLVEKYKEEEVSITVTGYSLGGAIAILNAVDIAANGHNKTTGQSEKTFPVTAIVFGSPCVGNKDFKKVFDELKDVHVLRIENVHDPVPKLPLIGYVHIGKEVEIDSTKSPYLKHGMKIVHNLEVYLHGIAGLKGGDEFELAIERDISLVNKYLDGVKDEYFVPLEWWVRHNNGMFQQDDGSWKFDDYVPRPPTP